MVKKAKKEINRSYEMKINNEQFNNEVKCMTFGRLKAGDVFEQLDEFGNPKSSSRSLYIKCGWQSDNHGKYHSAQRHTNAVSLIKGSKSFVFDIQLVAIYPDAVLNPGNPKTIVG